MIDSSRSLINVVRVVSQRIRVVFPLAVLLLFGLRRRYRPSTINILIVLILIIILLSLYVLVVCCRLGELVLPERGEELLIRLFRCHHLRASSYISNHFR